ncbi:MAG TPA: hypothetical protein VE326_00610 [Candidatus Binatia bacterium]|nr:hypothetical protein [Candidatus Binatia bacterium]
MHEAIAPSLEAWASFYVIVGSSAGALTGLQFVVMTLISGSGRPGGVETISAFGTPNVVHFCASLLVACLLSIPWRALHPAGVAVALCGALGVFYVLIVMRRASRQRDYKPVFEDWLWHVALPLLAYAVLLVAGAVLAGGVPDSLFLIGPASLLLVFVGIHNAWDTVTFLTASMRPSSPPPEPPTE